MITNAFLTEACEILAHTRTGLSGTQIVEHLSSYATDTSVEIPHAVIPFHAPNKRTALKENLVVFPPKQQARIIDDLCQLPKFRENQSVKELRRKLRVQYGRLLEDSIELTIITEARYWLLDYPDALKLYDEALQKYQSKIDSRNLLDNLRLSLEKLLQAMFDNKKSLENQMNNLGNFIINERQCPRELSNMFVTLVDYYSKYQNSYVKHDDAVVEKEVEFVFEITCCFMRFLVKLSLEKS